jgi:hypothetical protein
VDKPPEYDESSTNSSEHYHGDPAVSSFDFATANAVSAPEQSAPPLPEVWTDEALEQIPEGVRAEIEDGRLLRSPTPAFSHQRIAARLTRSLEDQCTAEWWPIAAGEIRIYEYDEIRQMRAPDILIVPRGLTEVNSIRGPTEHRGDYVGDTPFPFRLDLKL